jgi:hypothetical protein
VQLQVLEVIVAERLRLRDALILRLSCVLEAADANHDGLLTLDDLEAALSSVWPPCGFSIATVFMGCSSVADGGESTATVARAVARMSHLGLIVGKHCLDGLNLHEKTQALQDRSLALLNARLEEHLRSLVGQSKYTGAEFTASKLTALRDSLSAKQISLSSAWAMLKQITTVA